MVIVVCSYQKSSTQQNQNQNQHSSVVLILGLDGLFSSSWSHVEPQVTNCKKILGFVRFDQVVINNKGDEVIGISSICRTNRNCAGGNITNLSVNTLMDC